MKEMDEAKRQPLKEASDISTENEASDTRISQFKETGDASRMEKEDFIRLTPTEISDLKASGAIVDYNDLEGEENISRNFRGGWPTSSAEAKERFQKANPWAIIGNIVEKNGILYEITGMDSRDASTKYRRAQIMARPVKGGDPIAIHESSEYNP